VAAITPDHRPLFDRLHGLIVGEFPDVEVVISYKIPTYKVGRRRLYVGVWKHGLSIYGWERDHDGGFSERHPDLASSKGTIQLRPDVAVGITDAELLGLVRGALGPDPDDRR